METLAGPFQLQPSTGNGAWYSHTLPPCLSLSRSTTHLHAHYTTKGQAGSYGRHHHGAVEHRPLRPLLLEQRQPDLPQPLLKTRYLLNPHNPISHDINEHSKASVYFPLHRPHRQSCSTCKRRKQRHWVVLASPWRRRLERPGFTPTGKQPLQRLESPPPPHPARSEPEPGGADPGDEEAAADSADNAQDSQRGNKRSSQGSKHQP